MSINQKRELKEKGKELQAERATGARYRVNRQNSVFGDMKFH